MSIEEDALKQEKPQKWINIFSVIAAFLIFSIFMYFYCNSQINNVSKEILGHQRDLQQAVMDKTLDAIRVWRAEVVAQTRFVSTSEMFRLFMADTSELDNEALEKLAQPDSLHSSDETTRILAEQHAYIQDLLKDLTQRRAWNEARVINKSGVDIVCADFSTPLTGAQEDLVKKSIDTGKAVFGPLRHSSNGLVMDIADPLYEVVGIGEPKCIAALLVTLPMDRIIANFLVSTGDHGGGIISKIVDKSMGENNLLFMRGNFLQLETLPKPLTDESLPFEQRPAFAGTGNVYSMGAPVTMLDWLLVVETSAAILDSRIDSEKRGIYGLGIILVLIATICVGLAGKTITSHGYKKRSQQLERLYAKISQQKLILDSINSSLDSGLLLVDDKGYIRSSNQAFCRICCTREENLDGVPLPEVLKGEASIQLISDMVRVREKGENATVEILIPDQKGEKRLYRVNLFPYSALPGETATSGNGCVAVFQDITLFRAKAKRDRQRQDAMLLAMDRAIASVDPNLVGQSAKMAGVAQLLAEKLNLDAAQMNTLRLSSQLSQIGKLFVPRELLQKQGKLTDDERREVARAPEYADNILHDLHFGLPVQQTVREINERMDGSGPFGMKGENISLCGKILAVANSLVAMTSPRKWRNDKGMNLEDAVEILAKDNRFDPDVTSVLAGLNLGLLLNILNSSSGTDN